MFEMGIWMPTDVPLADIVEAARVADEEGFDYAFLADWGAGTRDVFVSMAAIAAATKRIKMGPGITNPYLRHLVVSATAVATVDEMSGGRAFMGLGLGGEATLLNPLGVHVERPLKMMREAIELLRSYYSGQSVQYDGEFFHVHGVSSRFARPDIPIYYAARGNQMLKLGGELTDGLLITGTARFDLQRTIEAFRQGAAISGRRPKLIYGTKLAYLPDMINDMRQDLAMVISASPESVHQGLGLTPRQVEEIRLGVENNDAAAATVHVTDDVAANFVIMGSEDECAAEIAAVMTQYRLDVYCVVVPKKMAPEPAIRKSAEIIRKAQRLVAAT